MQFPKLLSEAQMQDLLDTATRAQQAVLAAKDSLTPDMSSQQLQEVLTHYETYANAMSKAGQLIGAQVSVDLKNSSFRRLASLLDSTSVRLSEELLWFSLTLKSFPQQVLEQHANALPRFASYLRSIQKYVPHTLSEEQERVALLKDQTDALESVYDLVTNEFRYSIVIDGEERIVSSAELTPYYTHPDRLIRMQAVDQVHKRHKQHATLLSEIYVALAKDWDAEAVKLRSYPSPITPRHFGNDIDPKVYDALVSACQKNIDIFQEFLDLKRQLLNLDEFTKYDFSAPPPNRPKDISFEDAKERVLNAFGSFAPWMRESAQYLFDNERVDAYPRDNKRGGACCWPVTPDEDPLVLLNHSGDYEEAYTLAHEFGHAIHDLHTKNLSVLCASPPLVLAETASNFAELLLLDHELSVREDSTFLLVRFIQEALGSVPSQLRYTRFEERAHHLIETATSPEELSAEWSALLKQDFPAVDFEDESYMWLAIPHIFRTPFYCYAYSFGFLLACAFWQEAKKRDFTEDYKRFLCAGGSLPARELLAELGFDITDEAFWEQGFALIRSRVEELRAIVEK